MAVKNLNGTSYYDRVHEFKSGFAKHVGEDKLYGNQRFSKFHNKIDRPSELMLESKKRKKEKEDPIRNATHWWEIV